MAKILKNLSESVPKLSYRPKPTFVEISKNMIISAMIMLPPRAPNVSFSANTTGTGRFVFSNEKRFFLKLCVFIPPLRASSTLTLLYSELAVRATTATISSVPRTVDNAAVISTGWFQ